MTVIEALGGLALGSMSLIADGAHMATHAATLGLIAFAWHYSSGRLVAPRFAFGPGKIGALALFGVAILIGVLAAVVMAESATRLIGLPLEAIDSLAIGIALAAVVATIVISPSLRGHLNKSAAVSADDAHGPALPHARPAPITVMRDLSTSVLALAALLASTWLGWPWTDPLAALFGSLLVLRWTYQTARDAAAMLLDISSDDVAERIRSRLTGPDTRVTDLHVWRIGPCAHAVVMRASTELSLGELRERLQPIDGIVHLTIERLPTWPAGGSTFRSD